MPLYTWKKILSTPLLSLFNKRLIVCFICQLLFLSGTCPILKAQKEPFSFDIGSQEEPWHLSADRMEINRESKQVEAWGNVHLTKQNNYLQAEYARYFWDTKWVYLKKEVKIKWDQDYIQAKEAKFNLQNKIGWLQDGYVFLKEPHLYFQGERLEKVGPESYNFQDVKVTSCDGEIPAWSVRSKKGKITVDGYAKLWHSRFQIKDKPTLYSPYLVFPIKRHRQSGFLLPEYTTSDTKGVGLNIPYYLVINQEQDATFYFNYMSKRGVMLGSEYRLTPNLFTKGIFRFDWLSDKETASTEAEEKDDYRSDGLIRPNSDRYWIRGKFNGFLFDPDWKTKLDVDIVSDQNYLREFDDGYNGYERSRDMLLQEFGRDIKEKDDYIRENVWTVSRNWAHIGFNSKFEYNQNLAYMNDNKDPDKNPTLQRLPELNLNFYKKKLLDTFLEWEAENELTYFWRRFGIKGTRVDLHPQISWPLSSKFGTLIPKLGWRQTLYYVDHFENANSEKDNLESRGIWDFHIDGYTDIFRVFDLNSEEELKASKDYLGKSKWTKIKHSIRPQIEYSYVPKQDQEDLPVFDSIDRIQEENKLTYSITSILTRRKDTVLNVATGKGSKFDISENYLDFLRIKMEQSYDFREATRDSNLDQYPRRPFSDLRTEIDFKLLPWFTFRDTTWFSPYLGEITEHENMLHFTFKNKGNFYLGYDYQKKLTNDIHRKDQEAISILRTGAAMQIKPNWRVGLHYDQDLENSELIERGINVRYNHQCWNLEVDFTQTDDENRVTILVNLRQLGEIEQSFATEMN